MADNPDGYRLGTAGHIVRNITYSVIVLIFATVAFYTVPVSGLAFNRTGTAVAAFLLGLVVAAALVGWEVRSYRRNVQTGSARLRRLFVAIYLTVLYFALVYYVLSGTDPAEIAGLHTRTDALYFAVAIVSTVGFGDVHAAGQAARALVTLQMGFDLLFISLAVSAVRAAGLPKAPQGRAGARR